MPPTIQKFGIFCASLLVIAVTSEFAHAGDYDSPPPVVDQPISEHIQVVELNGGRYDFENLKGHCIEAWVWDDRIPLECHLSQKEEFNLAWGQVPQRWLSREKRLPNRPNREK